MADSANVVHGEVPVAASITHSKKGTIEEIVAEADEIYGHVKKRPGFRVTTDPSENDEKAAAAQLKELQEDYPDFNASFPLPLRWTVETGQYRSSAFERYLRYMRGREWKSREDFLRDQGEYLVYLFRETHKHFDHGQVARYRKALVEQLLKEDKEFEKAKEEAEKELKKRNEEVDQARRRAVFARLGRAPDAK